MSSWVRSAFSRTAKAASAGGKSFGASLQHAGAIAGAVGSFAGSVVQKAGDAVEKGAKIVYEQAESAVVRKKYNSFKHAVVRIEETAANLSGPERKAALHRWLLALQQIEAASSSRGQAEGAQAAAATDGGDADGAPAPQKAEKDKVKASSSAEASADAAPEWASGIPPDDPNGGGGLEIVRSSSSSSSTSSPSKAMLEAGLRRRAGVGSAPDAVDILFYDGDPNSSEPLSFRDVFLRSRALEHIVTSMISDPGEDDEWSMLRGLFRLCLAVDAREQDMVLEGIRKLSGSFAGYSEAKMPADSLLAMAADTISSLKLNPELERLDTQSDALAARIMKDAAALSTSSEKIDGLEEAGAAAAGAVEGAAKQHPHDQPEPNGSIAENAHPEGAGEAERVPVQADAPLSEADSQFRALLPLASQWVELQRKKQSLLQQGDTPGDRILKVERLTALATQLQDSAEGAQTRIMECRKQREEAVLYREKKAQEHAEVEKVVAEQMCTLQQRKEELEQQLNEVLSSIATLSRQQQTSVEEREEFKLASTNMVSALAAEEKTKEDQSRDHQIDAKAMKEWQAYLQTSWPLELACSEMKETKQRLQVLEVRPSFLTAVATLLQRYKDEVQSLGAQLQAKAEKLSALVTESEMASDGAGVAEANTVLSDLEDDYLWLEQRCKAFCREALSAALEAQKWMEWSQSYPQASGESQDESKVKELILSLQEEVAVVKSQPRPPLARENPIVSQVRAFSRRTEGGRGWDLEAVDTILQTNTIVAPVTPSAQPTKGPSSLQPLKPIVPDEEPTDVLPTPHVIGGRPN